MDGRSHLEQKRCRHFKGNVIYLINLYYGMYYSNRLPVHFFVPHQFFLLLCWHSFLSLLASLTCKVSYILTSNWVIRCSMCRVAPYNNPLFKNAGIGIALAIYSITQINTFIASLEIHNRIKEVGTNNYIDLFSNLSIILVTFAYIKRIDPNAARNIFDFSNFFKSKFFRLRSRILSIFSTIEVICSYFTCLDECCIFL